MSNYMYFRYACVCAHMCGFVCMSICSRYIMIIEVILRNVKNPLLHRVSLWSSAPDMQVYLAKEPQEAQCLYLACYEHRHAWKIFMCVQIKLAFITARQLLYCFSLILVPKNLSLENLFLMKIWLIMLKWKQKIWNTAHTLLVKPLLDLQ